MKKTLIISVIGAAALVAAFFLGSVRGRNKAISAMKPKVDTLVVFDTIREEMPVPVTRWRDKVYYVEVPAWDTLHVHHHDTTFLALPLEHKEYRKPNYYARISGYNPNLDYIETYQETKTILAEKLITPERKPYYIGAEGEFLYTWNDLAFAPVTLNLGYDAGWLDLSGGLGYDFIQRQPIFKASLRLTPIHWK